MKASLLFVAGLAIAISSIAPANAAPANPAPADPAATWRTGCSWSAGWRFSPTCRNLANFKTYVECTTGVTKQGTTASDAYWYCSSLGFKN
jgi:hypothetical protein